MKQDRGQTEASDSSTSEASKGAPGKRTMTTGLGPVQQRSLTSNSAPPPVQMESTDSSGADDPYNVHLAASRGVEGGSSSLPFLDNIQRSFGPDHDVSGVQAHVGGPAAQATRDMGASAYATGNHVAFGSSPDLHTAAHEAAHVVQQSQGVQLYGGVGAAGDSYEQNADAVADRVVAGESAADLLGPATGASAGGAVQKKGAGAREKSHGKGYSKYGGGTVKSVLTKLVEAGDLNITGQQIAILDAVAQVETGGQIACVQTYDDQIMSVGFKQVVLGHGSLEKMMKKAPQGFEKHGLSLDTSKVYTHAGWSKKPHQIAGCEDEEELRGRDWGEKFFQASMEPDVVKAMCELALGELGEVKGQITKRAGGIDHFSDTTALSWLLECKNNRPAFTPKAIQRAVDNGAKSAGSRDKFLDILADALIKTYEIEEPILKYTKDKAAKKKKGITLSADEDAALLAAAKASHTTIGHRKGNNIVTKIGRNVGDAKVGAATAKKPAAVEERANEPAQSEAPAPAPADEVLMSVPAPEPENVSYPEEEQNQSFPDAGMSLPPPPAPEPPMSVAPAVTQIEQGPAQAVPQVIEAPPAPPAVEVAPPAPPAPPEPSWSKEARAYHRKNSEYVDQFNAATSNTCVGPDGELVPNEVARWQAAHGVKPDGYCGPLTVSAAVGNAPPPEAIAPIPPPPPLAAPTVAGPSLSANVPNAAPDVPAPIAPAPSPTAGPEVKAPVVPKIEPKPVEVAQDAPKAEIAPAQKPVKGQATRMVVKGGSQSCLVFISPDGITSKPDLFIFFHGYQADYGDDVDTKQKRPAKMKLYKSGSDVAEEAMAYASGKNLISILPQGNIGRDQENGGHMKALEGGLEPFLKSVLANLAKEMGMESLTPNHIGLAGHSAGGYEGMHAAMGDSKKMGEYADSITDVTLMDSAYGGSHFADARDWIFTGSPGKSLRIIGSAKQLADGRKGGHHEWFDEGKLKRYADKRDFTIKELPDGDQRDTSKVVQHTQILTKDGAVQGDIIILMSKRKGDAGHHQIRDDVMDDAILSVGQGAAGNNHFDQKLGAAIAEEHDDEQPEAPEQAGGGGATGATEDELPAPQHVAGQEDGAKEPVAAPPAPAVEPKPKADKPKKKSGGKEADRERLYGEKGIIRTELLHQSVKGKDASGKKMDVVLTDAQFQFKKDCYEKGVERLGDRIFGGVPADEMRNVKDGGKLRHAAADQAEALIAELNAAAPDAKTRIRPGSCYRRPEEDFDIFDKAFNNIYCWKTEEERKKRWPDKPYGPEAVLYLLEWIKGRKAIPGGSNHSNGIAIDFQIMVDGDWKENKVENQKAWNKSFQLKWLKENAARFQFKNIPDERWHWDYKGPL